MKQKSLLLSNAIIGVIMIILILPLFIMREVPSYEVPAFRVDCDAGWDTELGEMKLSDPKFRDDGTITLTRTVKRGEVRSGDLCLTSSNVNFIVYVDERMVYRYEPDLAWIYGRSYGNDIHAIPISPGRDEAVIRIEVTSLNTGAFIGFKKAHFENGADYVRGILSGKLIHYYLSALTLTFSILLFVMGWFFRKGDNRRPETISLGILGIIFSLWTECSEYTMVLLTGHAELIRIISYYALIFLPIPGATLVCHLTNKPKSPIQLIISFMTMLNLILHIALLYLKKADYHQLLPITHGVLLLSILMVVIATIQSARKKLLSSHSSRVLLSAFLIMVISGIVDMIRFYVERTQNIAEYSRYGFLVFMVIIGSYEIREFVLMLQASHETEMMKNLAHRDGLTGLENRLAFTEWENSIHTLKKGSCIFVLFDINNLKEVNDNYGHDAGDAFIIAGANAIHSSFGPYGRTFRIGGDEFVTVLTTAAPSSTETLTNDNAKLMYNNSPDALMKCYEACIKHLQEILDAYNLTSGSPVPLTIAYGMAEYSLSQGNPEKQERLADERMYMHKRMMKQAANR